MNSNQGFTCEPMMYIDPQTGEERLSYDHAVVEDHSIRRAEYDQVQDQQSQYITEDSQGNREHFYNIGDEGQLYDEGQDLIDDEWESDEEDFDDSEIFEYIEETLGEGVYDQLISWAEENLDDDDIEGFNDAMDTNDPETMLRWIAALYQAAVEDEDEDEDEEDGYDY